MTITAWRRRALWSAVLLLCLVPLGRLLFDAATDGLGAEPVEEITHRTGFWGLTFLLITLGITPLRRLTGWNGIIRFRRTLGLVAFTFAVLHFSTYLVLDQFFAWSYILEDIAERPYITVGFTSFLLLIPLALTSTNGMIRRLGKRWGKLHRLVYLAAAGGVLHFLWLVKADLRRPVIFGTILVGLLALRLVSTDTFRRFRAALTPGAGRDPSVSPRQSGGAYAASSSSDAGGGGGGRDHPVDHVRG